MLSLVVGFAGVSLAQEEFTASLGGTFLGPTGLVLVPTAEGLSKQEIRASLHTFKPVDEPGYEITDSILAVTYGVTENLEVGVGVESLDWKIGALSDTETGYIVSAKYAFPLSETSPAAFAVGGIYEKFELSYVSETKSTTLYVVASKALGEKAKVHLGAGWGKDEVTAGVTTADNSDFAYFAGVELLPIPRLTISAEYLSQPDDENADTEDRTIGFGARYAVTEKLNLEAAMVDFGGKEKDYNYFAGFSYTF